MRLGTHVGGADRLRAVDNAHVSLVHCGHGDISPALDCTLAYPARVRLQSETPTDGEGDVAGRGSQGCTHTQEVTRAFPTKRRLVTGHHESVVRMLEGDLLGEAPAVKKIAPLKLQTPIERVLNSKLPDGVHTAELPPVQLIEVCDRP